MHQFPLLAGATNRFIFLKKGSQLPVLRSCLSRLRSVNSEATNQVHLFIPELLKSRRRLIKFFLTSLYFI